MTDAILIGGLIICLSIGLQLRGERFHEHLIQLVVSSFSDAGFDVAIECPRELPDRRTAFIDILATRAEFEIACEVETTVRNAASNVQKVGYLGLPLLVVVPTRQLCEQISRQIGPSASVPKRKTNGIWILLPDEIPAVLASCFPVFPTANVKPFAGKSNERRLRRYQHRSRGW